MLLLQHLAMSVWQNLPEEVGWYLPPSACLPTYSTCLVWSGQMPADSLALSFYFPLFLSIFLFLMTGMDGLYLSLPFHQYFHPTSFLCAPSLHHHHHHHHPSFEQFNILESSQPFSWDPSGLLPCLCTCISVWGTDRRVGKVERGEMQLAFVRKRNKKDWRRKNRVE